jgi:hypothetical protein
MSEDVISKVRDILSISKSQIKRRAGNDDPLNRIYSSENTSRSKRTERNSHYQRSGYSNNFIQMSERLVFSRVIGNPECALSGSWIENENCWICSNYT